VEKLDRAIDFSGWKVDGSGGVGKNTLKACPGTSNNPQSEINWC